MEAFVDNVDNSENFRRRVPDELLSAGDIKRMRQFIDWVAEDCEDGLARGVFSSRTITYIRMMAVFYGDKELIQPPAVN
jgi:hypothetical protein